MLGLDQMLGICVMDILWSSIFFVCALFRGFFRRGFVEDLDLVSKTHFLAYCLILKWREEEGKGRQTSNCHLSMCSPVSLLVITTTSFDIFPPTIHLSSCDIIFLIYALTWSSEETSIVRPYFLTLRGC
jgi:hypothetical protein